MSHLFLIPNEQITDQPHHVLSLIVGRFSFTERRPPNAYPANPFDEHQRLHRQQVHHQPQPQQPARFSQFLNVPGYQGGMGASSSSQSASSSRSQTISSFAGELYSEGQPEIKPFYQGSSMAEHPAIETREAVPGRKKARRSPAVRRGPRAPTEGGIAGPSTGATTSAKGKSLAKVAVACNFCRGEHFGLHSTFVFENLIEPPIGISARAVHCDID